MERTRRRIIDAFFDLQEETDKYTVRAICERAGINKSTFYKHYSSINDLVDKIDAAFVETVINYIPDLEVLIRDPERCVEIVRQLHASPLLLYSHRLNEKHLNRTLSKLHQAVREHIFSTYPQLRDNIMANIHISFLIYGGNYAFYQNVQFGGEAVCDVIGQFVKFLFTFVEEILPKQNA